MNNLWESEVGVSERIFITDPAVKRLCLRCGKDLTGTKYRAFCPNECKEKGNDLER